MADVRIDASAETERAQRSERALVEAEERAARTRRDASEVAGRLQRTVAELADVHGTTAELQAELDSVRAAALVRSGGSRVALLWSLELARVERTWRASVTTDQTVSSGVADAADPVAAAVAVDAAAAREDIGTEVGVRVDPSISANTEDSLVTVRAVHEVIAAVAAGVETLLIEVGYAEDHIVVEVMGDGVPQTTELLEVWRENGRYRL